MKFAVNDLVALKKSFFPNQSYQVYKVVAILNKAILVVHYGSSYHDGVIDPFPFKDEPGSRSWRSAIERYQEKECLSIEEAKVELVRVNEAADKLNQEFESVRGDVETKFGQAAALVAEAAAIVKAHNKTFYDMRKEGMSLYRALEGGGWSHSHMKC